MEEFNQFEYMPQFHSIAMTQTRDVTNKSKYVRFVIWLLVIYL